MNLHYTWFEAEVKRYAVVWKQQLRGNNRALALAKMALDFGTGWRIMDGVEGNGVDMAAAR